MGILSRIEQRYVSTNLGHPSKGDPVLEKIYGGVPSFAGVSFDEMGALSWSALSCGVRLSSETLGSLPGAVFQKNPSRKGKYGEVLPGGRTAIEGHAVSLLLSEDGPNPEQTRMEFVEQQQAHSLWWGTSYAQIIFSNGGKPLELWPLNPDRVLPERVDGELWWKVTFPGDVRMLPAREVLVVRGFAGQGLVGERLADLHKQTIGLGLATEFYSAGFFGQGATAAGFLSHPKSLSPKAKANLQESLEKKTEGLTRAHRIRLLEEGLTWHQISIDPEKSQLILGRQFQVLEAARILRIAPHLLYSLERATFSNIEHQSLEFIRDHARIWTIRREQRYGKQLFTNAERTSGLFYRSNLDALLRGDFESRMRGYAQAIQNRIRTPNECRALEDLNPGPPELDEFQVTPNMNAPSNTPPASPAPPKEPPDEDES